jgi:DNA-binding transcriptional regulator YiaG
MVDEAMRIRVIRAIIGCDRQTLQKRLGVSDNVVRNWEDGTSIPQRKNRAALAEICRQYNIAIRPDGFPVPVSE